MWQNHCNRVVFFGLSSSCGTRLALKLFCLPALFRSLGLSKQEADLWTTMSISRTIQTQVWCFDPSLPWDPSERTATLLYCKPPTLVPTAPRSKRCFGKLTCARVYATAAQLSAQL